MDTSVTGEIERLTDLIYESAVIPDLWPKTLDGLSRLAACDGAALFTLDTSHNVRFASCGVCDGIRDLINEGWMNPNPRVQRAVAKQHAGFLTDHDMFTPEELDREPFYDWLRSHGGGWAVGTVVLSPSRDIVTLTIDRAQDKGPIGAATVATLDHLRPHIARAGLLACRLGLERAKSMVNALDLIGLPAAVLRADGRMLAANAKMTKLDRQFVFRAFDFLAIAQPDANALLKDALAGSSANAVTRSIPLPAVDDYSAAIAHIVPTKGTAADVFSFASSILVVTPLSTPNAPTADVLNGLFDLTPTEARVAQALVRGASVEEIARLSGVAEATVRVQVRSVLAKTGTHRQAELVAMLCSSLPFSG